MEAKFEQMYDCLGEAVENTKTLLSEALSVASAISENAEDRHQIRAGILETQVQAVITDLSRALADAEKML